MRTGGKVSLLTSSLLHPPSAHFLRSMPKTTSPSSCVTDSNTQAFGRNGPVRYLSMSALRSESGLYALMRVEDLSADVS